jgi:hypothetical protein
MEAQTQNERITDRDEDQLLSSLGYLVLRWNYAEHFARQILRSYIPEGGLSGRDHLKLTRARASSLEERLEKEAIPNWKQPGKEFLNQLIDAFASAREYRNRIVHDAWDTFPARGDYQACLIRLSLDPKYEKLPPQLYLTDLRKIADHFHDLAMFAREVSLTFTSDGSIAINSDGSPVMEKMPEAVRPLPDLSSLKN